MQRDHATTPAVAREHNTGKPPAKLFSPQQKAMNSQAIAQQMLQNKTIRRQLTLHEQRVLVLLRNGWSAGAIARVTPYPPKEPGKRFYRFCFLPLLSTCCSLA